jgi:hypothetical protein
LAQASAGGHGHPSRCYNFAVAEGVAKAIELEATDNCVGPKEREFMSQSNSSERPDRRDPNAESRAENQGDNHGASQGRRQARSNSKDITPLLKGWDYEPGTINVRKVSGNDGHPKLQMRLDLGLLQMELTGRPDGLKPHGCESLLEYFESQLKEHELRNGTELGFHLTGQQCQSLREEAVMYYHRYLSLFVLEDFPGVVRDTDRNLRVLDLCGRYAVDEQDRLVLEQYRPYITMMNARAAASILFKEKRYAEAHKRVKQGIASIRAFFDRFGQGKAINQSNEVRVLKRFAREIRRKMPVDPLAKLKADLEKAVQGERYEDAAKLRDQIHSKREIADASGPAE